MYLKILEQGSPLAVRASSFAVSALLILLVAVPLVSVAVRIVA